MPEELSRRSFLKLAATVGAAAAIPGCEPAARQLIPYVVPDDNVIPGVPQYYATTCAECGAGCGLIAKIREGRTIFLGGNPADPIGAGSVCARGQAALQGLYNPDRLREPQMRGLGGKLARISWNDAQRRLAERLRAAAGAGKDRVVFLGTPQGPTFAKIVDAFMSASGSSRTVFYEAITAEPARNAARQLFGRDDLPVLHIDKAEVLVSFGADFNETFSSPVELARQYAEFRAPKMRRGALDIGRAFYVGPRLNATAAKCDEWVSVAPGGEAQLAWSVLHVMVAERWVSQNSGVDLGALTAMVQAYDPAAVSVNTGVPPETIKRIADAFGKADGAIALAPSSDESATLAAYVLNAVTGNLGRTMVFLDGAPAPETTPSAQVEAAVAAMRDGKVDVAVIAGGANPVFSMPRAWRVAEGLQKVSYVAWLGTVPDETTEMASLLLPAHHPLESWRDINPRAGVWGLGQPVMQPVVNSRAIGDILLATMPAGKPAPAPAAGAAPSANGASGKGTATAAVPASAGAPWKNTHEAVEATWKELATKAGTPDAAQFWTKARQEGGYFAEAKPAAVQLNPAALKTPQAAPSAPAQLLLSSYPHIFLYDGRGADKPWLQELPEPISQYVWDSWAEINPETARRLNVKSNQIIELHTPDGMIELPASLNSRIHEGVISVPIGQGHTSYGRYAKGRGANPWAILPPGALSVAVKVSPTANSRKLVSPLFHRDEPGFPVGSMLGRDIVLASTIEDLAAGKVPEEKPLAPEPYEMYPHFPYPTHMWGMTIDVNACTACSACVTACYAENNVAVVGKDLVDDGRIMSWIRIERYYPDNEKDAEKPLAYLAPMLCQQCDHAPCEPVCPVFAAYHTQEGLNGQIYNRCVGTRYCENNCPYKVRRFNWYEYDFPAPLNLQLNPDVTVRGAGVMEKCTFCIQRIQHAEITARVEKREVRDGEIVPACAGACPTRAIQFGDMNNRDSVMMRKRTDHKARDYRALVDLNTQPAIVYLRALHHRKGQA
jgi:anaerobic selenocysteine-containing dehydrogenase/Fe-S-cluster-containing dehydrogenase component